MWLRVLQNASTKLFRTKCSHQTVRQCSRQTSADSELDTGLNLRGISSADGKTISFWRRDLLHGVTLFLTYSSQPSLQNLPPLESAAVWTPLQALWHACGMCSAHWHITKVSRWIKL
jgi:hypothetical protein